MILEFGLSGDHGLGTSFLQFDPCLYISMFMIVMQFFSLVIGWTRTLILNYAPEYVSSCNTRLHTISSLSIYASRTKFLVPSLHGGKDGVN